MSKKSDDFHNKERRLEEDSKDRWRETSSRVEFRERVFSFFSNIWFRRSRCILEDSSKRYNDEMCRINDHERKEEPGDWRRNVALERIERDELAENRLPLSFLKKL